MTNVSDAKFTHYVSWITAVDAADQPFVVTPIAAGYDTHQINVTKLPPAKVHWRCGPYLGVRRSTLPKDVAAKFERRIKRDRARGIGEWVRVEFDKEVWYAHEATAHETFARDPFVPAVNFQIALA